MVFRQLTKEERQEHRDRHNASKLHDGPCLCYEPGAKFEVQYGQPVPAAKYYKRLMPTGLHLAVPPNYVALIRERGSVTKTTLAVRAGVVDAGYTGEIFVGITNVGPLDWLIPAGAKSPFQILVVPVLNEFKAMPLQGFSWHVQNSKRGAGKIGSSD